MQYTCILYGVLYLWVSFDRATQRGLMYITRCLHANIIWRARAYTNTRNPRNKQWSWWVYLHINPCTKSLWIQRVLKTDARQTRWTTWTFDFNVITLLIIYLTSNIMYIWSVNGDIHSPSTSLLIYM